MMFANLLLGVSLVAASPTNAPAAFSTEAEQTFPMPDITERNVWLDCGIGFSATSSNRIEIAFGPDLDGDGLLGDDEAPFVFSIDCGRMIVRDGNGNELHSEDAFDYPLLLSFVPARRGAGDIWKIGYADEAPFASDTFPEGLPPLTAWNLARVRMNGPDLASARVSLQKNRFATVFIIR